MLAIILLAIYLLIILEGMFLVHITEEYVLRINIGDGIKLEKVNLSNDYDYHKLLATLLIPGFQLLFPVFLNTMLNNYWHRRYMITNSKVARYFKWRVNYDDSIVIVENYC